MILVTGATGFIGREVVRRFLLARRPMIALARRSDGATAAERVVAAVGGIPHGAHLEVVEGDLTAPECALAPADWRRLSATVETVIHCAGDTTFAPAAMAPYVAGHVDGPRALLEGLAGGRLRRWAHLSTAYVCGRRSGTILERDADIGQAFNNAYERVKLESERALRAAGVRLGVDVRVFRPSIVVGAAPPTAGGNPSNLFFGFIRMVVLDEAVRVTRRRLLVVESVYRNRLDRFWLDLLDGRLNRYRHGGAMNVPLAFRRPEEWRALFESRGLRVAATEWLGSPLERLIHHPLLYALDK